MVPIRFLSCLFWLSVSIFWTNSLFAQIKYEREYRLKTDQVPVAARAFVAACQFEGKIRWYQEESASGTSVEGKIKAHRVRYSLEFDTLGRIQDVEVGQAWERLPPTTRAAIRQLLDQQLERHTLTKVQLQWTGPEPVLQALIRGEVPDSAYTTRYEIVVHGKDATGVHGYEYLFDEQGKLEHRSRIVFRNTDNLDY